MRALLILILLIVAVSFFAWVALAVEDGGPKVDSPADRAASDVSLIAEWIVGNRNSESFEKPFSNSVSAANAKDALFYTDVRDVRVPELLRQVPYEFARARLEAVQQGHDLDPVLLITRTVSENPKDGTFGRDADVLIPGTDHRFYYIEYSTGNLGSHWMKIAVWEEEGVSKTTLLYKAVS